MESVWRQLVSVGNYIVVLAVVFVLLAYNTIVVCAEEAKFAETGVLPVLVFQTDGKAVQDRSRVPASLTVLLPEEGGSKFSIDKTASGPAELSVRGNSSYYYPKKSSRLEMHDENGKDRKASLLSLPADSDWVLYASVTDKTFTRNVLAHELWRSTGRYAVRCRFAEVFVLTNTSAAERLSAATLASAVPAVLKNLDGPNRIQASHSPPGLGDGVLSRLTNGFMGLYVVMEKIKRGKERVNIARLRPANSAEPDVSGGYIIKKDDETRSERGLLTGQEFKLRFEEPKESRISPEQRDWLAGYLDRFEKTLFGLNYRDQEHGYRRYVDVESFIDFHWLVEVARNADGFSLSQYMHKHRNEKLEMGPIWDWDATFANPFFRAEFIVEGWRSTGATDPDYAWYRRMFEDPDFFQRYIDRWSELRTNVLATTNVLSRVARISMGLGPAAHRNEAVWRSRLPTQPANAYTAVGFEDQLTRLTNWIALRLDWIESQAYPKPVLNSVRAGNGASVTMRHTDGRLYYSTNGIDPRMSGGGVSPLALEYSKALQVVSPTTIMARTRSHFGLWSAPVVLKVAPDATVP